MCFVSATPVLPQHPAMAPSMCLRKWEGRGGRGGEGGEGRGGGDETAEVVSS